MRYKDIDLNLKKDPVTDDITINADNEAIKASLKNLILTEPFDRRFQPDLFTGVTALLFENMSPVVVSSMQRVIEDAIRNFEPRVDLVSVRIIPFTNENRYDVTIKYRILNRPEPVQLTIPLQRRR